jgi:hypothetical protein
MKSILLLFLSSVAFAQNPVIYYKFDSPASGSYTTSPRPAICPVSPSTSSVCMNFQYYSANYKIESGGPVGQFLTLDATGKLAYRDTTTTFSSTSFTLEFLFKHHRDFISADLMGDRFGNGINLNVKYPNLRFDTKTTAGTDNFTILMNGTGRKNWNYLFDGNWHHLALSYNQSTGEKKLYIDGYSLPEFRKVLTPGLGIVLGEKVPSIGDNTSYRHPIGSYDEIAMFNVALSDAQIYGHYQNFINGQSYNFASAGTTPPAISSTTLSAYDTQQFAPSVTLPTVMNAQNVVLSASVPSVLSQLKTFPAARYRKGNTLEKNFNWFDSTYLGGKLQPGVSVYTGGPVMVDIEKELALNWNYYQTLGSQGQIISSAPANNSWDYYKMIAMNSPELVSQPIDFVIFRAGVGDLRDQTYSSNCYLKNAAGQWLDEGGNVSSSKFLRPTSSATGPCPDSTLDGGLTIRDSISSMMSFLPNKNIRIINENGEILNRVNDNLVGTDVAKVDPTVKAEQQASGLDFYNFQSRWRSRLEKYYADQILDPSHPKLSQAKYTSYQINGVPDYFWKWSFMKDSQSQIGGKKRATGDFYLRNPAQWMVRSSGADHGLEWFQVGKHHERLSGDEFISPYVCAGWDHIEEKNLRPNRWLGLLKILNGLGAEFFYTGFFNAVNNYAPNTPYVQEPRNWVWQVALASYAQATISRFDDFYKNSSAMAGDMLASYDPPRVEQGYRFKTGNMSQFVTVRKHNTLPIYMIFGTVQPLTNFQGETYSNDATIVLDGQTLKFKVRSQGSVYLYDRSITPNAFYQIDSWHEAKHPWYWSKDFVLEGELADAANASYRINTSSNHLSTLNFVGHAAYLKWNNLTNHPRYSFFPRDNSTRNYYTWVRARATNSSTVGQLTLEYRNKAGTLVTTKTLSNVSGTSFKYYRVEPLAGAASLNNLNMEEYEIRVVANTINMELDKLILTSDGARTYSGAIYP